MARRILLFKTGKEINLQNLQLSEFEYDYEEGWDWGGPYRKKTFKKYFIWFCSVTCFLSQVCKTVKCFYNMDECIDKIYEWVFHHANNTFMSKDMFLDCLEIVIGETCPHKCVKNQNAIVSLVFDKLKNMELTMKCIEKHMDVDPKLLAKIIADIGYDKMETCLEGVPYNCYHCFEKCMFTVSELILQNNISAAFKLYATTIKHVKPTSIFILYRKDLVMAIFKNFGFFSRENLGVLIDEKQKQDWLKALLMIFDKCDSELVQMKICLLMSEQFDDFNKYLPLMNLLETTPRKVADYVFSTRHVHSQDIDSFEIVWVIIKNLLTQYNAMALKIFNSIQHLSSNKEIRINNMIEMLNLAIEFGIKSTILTCFLNLKNNTGTYEKIKLAECVVNKWDFFKFSPLFSSVREFLLSVKVDFRYVDNFISILSTLQAKDDEFAKEVFGKTVIPYTDSTQIRNDLKEIVKNNSNSGDCWCHQYSRLLFQCIVALDKFEPSGKNTLVANVVNLALIEENPWKEEKEESCKLLIKCFLKLIDSRWSVLKKYSSIVDLYRLRKLQIEEKKYIWCTNVGDSLFFYQKFLHSNYINMCSKLSQCDDPLFNKLIEVNDAEANVGQTQLLSKRVEFFEGGENEDANRLELSEINKKLEFLLD